MHNVGSFGTENNPPSGFNGRSGASRAWSRGVGFIADFGLDGFGSGSPSAYAGDYFLPGTPLEGWSIEFKTSPSGGVNRYLFKGRVGAKSYTPTLISDTSTPGRLSAVWIGKVSNLKISQSTSFGENDLFFTTTVTLKNEGTSKMYDVDYMRNVDPDQEQPWTGNYRTLNWVKYQPRRAGEARDYSHPTIPGMCLVIATGTHSSYTNSHVLGLGAVTTNCRVSHYGFRNDDAAVGWSNTNWHSYSESSPQNADQGINLVIRTPELDPGASETFTWAYILRESDLLVALGTINDAKILQPTDTVSGTSVTFSCETTTPTTRVQFYVGSTHVGTSTTASASVGDTGGGVFSITFDATAFSTGDGYTFKADVTLSSGSSISATKTIRIDNTGPTMRADVSVATSGGVYQFSNLATTRVTGVHTGGPSPSSVSFFRELSSGSSLIRSDSSSPYTADLDLSGIAPGTAVTVKVVGRTSDGREGVATVSGVVAEPNSAPTSISLSSTSVAENSAAGTNIGTLSTADPNSGDTFTYAVTSGGTCFQTSSNKLQVKSASCFDYEAATSKSVTVRTTDSGGLTKSVAFTILVTNVNEHPTSVSLSSASVSEAASVNTVVGSVSVSDPDSSSHTLTMTDTGGGRFRMSGTNVVVASSLDHESAGSVTIKVKATDPGGLTRTGTFTITVTDANEKPASIALSHDRVSENEASGATIGSLSTTDPDAGQSHSYSIASDPAGAFQLSGAVLKTKVVFDYEIKTSYDVSIKSTDNGSPALSRTTTFTVHVEDVEEPPVASVSTMYVPENSPISYVVGTIPATDKVNTFNFAINAALSSPDADHFTIHPCSGTVFVAKDVLDFETAPTSYTLKVDVTGHVSSLVTVNVFITNVNEPPVLSPITTAIAESARSGHVVVSSIAANDPDSTAITWSIDSGNLGGMFRIDSSSGRITVNLDTLNYENLAAGTKFFELFVTATDGSLRDTTTVRVNINDVNEPPVVTSTTAFTIDENSAVNSELGNVAVFDEDGDDVTFSIRSGNTGGAFKFSASSASALGGAKDTAALQVASSVLNYESKSSYVLGVRATDSAGATTDFTVSVTLSDVNESPSIGSSSVSYNINENSPIGTVIANMGSMVSDPDAGAVITWTASDYGVFTPSFVSVSGTGVLSLVGIPNHESQAAFTLTVRATDQGGLFDSVAVTVNILDLNEPPQMTASTTRSVAEAQGSGADVILGAQRVDVCAFEPDGQGLTYSISDPSGMFRIEDAPDPTGVVCGRIRTTKTLNFEADPVTTATTVTACDDASPPACASTAVTITIEDVNEAPSLGAVTLNVGENSEAGSPVGNALVAVDPDAGDNVEMTIVSGDTGGVFSLVRVSDLVWQLNVAGGVSGTLQALGPRSYSLGVSIADAAGLSPASPTTVTVALVEENDPPVVAPATFIVPESAGSSGSQVGTVVGTVTATDPEGHAVRWSITGGNPGSVFTINPTTGAISVASAVLDHEGTTNEFLLTVRAVDVPPSSSEPLAGSATITVRTSNVNESPAIPNPPAVSVFENLEVGDAIGGPVLATDVDAGSALTYRLLSDTATFAIHPTSGQVTVAAATLDFETRSSYNIRVEVSDAGGLTAENSLAVSLLDDDEAPVLTDSQVRSVAENSPVGTLVGGALPMADQDGLDTHDWAITAGAGGMFAIGPTGQLSVKSPNLNFEAKHTYTLTVKVTDSSGLSDTTSVKVNIVDVNEAASFVPSTLELKSVNENSAVGTTVAPPVQATDPDGHPLTYSFPAGEETFAIDPSSGIISVAAAVLDFEVKNVYTVTVLVTDIKDSSGDAITVSSTFTVSIVDQNEAPVAVFDGARFDVDENLATGTPIGTLVASDVDAGDSLTFSIATPGFNVFNLDPSSGLLKVSAALDFETRATYLFDARVTDAAGLSAVGTVSVTVNDVNEPPSIADAARSVDENSPRNTVVGDVLPATDPDIGQFLTFEIVDGDGTFAVNPCSGQLTVATASLNFEAQASYTFQVRVRDDGLGRLTDTATVTVTVNDVNEAPTVAAADYAIPENSVVETNIGSPVGRFDPDGGDSLSFFLSDGNDDGLFAISASTGQITVARDALDYETRTLYSVEVTARDAAGATGANRVSITVTDVNENPVVPAVTRSVEENSAAGTVVTGGVVPFSDVDGDSVTWSLTSDAFAVDSATGQLTVKAPVLNFEAQPVHTLNVVATDAGGLTGTGVVTVNLVDVNEVPALGAATRAIDENAANGAPVGALIVGTDVDTADKLTYSIVDGDPSETFRVQTVTGGSHQGAAQLSVRGAVNHETQDQYRLTLQVNDGALTSTAVVTVNINDVNEFPEIEAQTRHVDENVPAGTEVGPPVIAFDVDDGDSLSFAITSGGGKSRFNLDATTGQLTTKDVALDRETLSAADLAMVVTVTDASGLSASATIQVVLDNVNEAPVLADATLGVNEKAKLNDNLAGAPRASDVDGDNLVYSIVGAADKFAVHPTTGAIYVADAPVVPPSTAPIDPDTGLLRTAVLTIRVVDDGSPAMSTDATVTIEVYNENDPPVAPPFSMTVAENAAKDTVVGTVTFTDPDDHGLTYSLDSVGNNGEFVIDASTGTVFVGKSDTLDFEAEVAQYELRVLCTDDGPGKLTGETSLLITVRNVNERPTVIPVPMYVNENVRPGTELVAFDDTGAEVDPLAAATDPDLSHGDFLRWTVSGAGGRFAIDEATGRMRVADGAGASETAAPLNFEEQSSFDVVVTAVDADGLSDDAVYTITIRDVNDAPVMDAGQAKELTENTVAGAIVGTVLTASDEDSGDARLFSIPASSPDGSNCWRLSATGTTEPEWVSTPVATPGSFAATFTVAGKDWMYLTLAESIASSSSSTIVHQVALGGVGGGAARFVGVRSTTTPGSSAKFPSAFTTRMDVDEATWAEWAAGDLWVAVSAENQLTVGLGSVPGANTVVLHNLPSAAGPVEYLGFAASPSDGSVAVLDKLCFPGAGDVAADLFTVDESGQIFTKEFVGGIDFERRSEYSMLVRVSDGALHDDQVVHITVLDVNEAPVVRDTCASSSATVCLSVTENSGPGTVVTSSIIVDDQEAFNQHSYQLVAGNVRNAFSLSVDGVLTVVSDVLDHEDGVTGGVYHLDIVVTDDGEPALSAGATLRVTIEDENEVPELASQARTVEENSPEGELVGPALAAFDIDDGAHEWGQLTFSLESGDGVGAFTVSASGQVAVAPGADLDFETKDTYVLGMRVTDGGGLLADATLTITLIDVNEAPFIDDATREIEENSAVKAPAGDFLFAYDYDANHNETLRYSITGGDGSSVFRVNPCSGVILVADAVLDFEAKSSYSLVVRVTDEGGLWAEADVTVNLLNVNEHPIIQFPGLNVRHVPENSAADTAVELPPADGSTPAGLLAAVQAVDPDGDGLTYVISGGSGSALFAIDADTGVVSVATGAALDHEDDDHDGVLHLELQVWDDGSVTGQDPLYTGHTFTVVLDDVNEAPSLVMPAEAPHVFENVDADTPFDSEALRGTDPDTKAVDPAWVTLSFAVVGGSGASLFTVDATTGQLYVTSPTLNYEATNSYSLDIEVTDAAGQATTSTITVAVKDVNEAPVMDDQVLTVLENSPAGTSVDPGAVLCTDVDTEQTQAIDILNPGSADARAFTVDRETGLVSLASVPDFETKPVIHLTMKCSDSGLLPVLSDQATITIQVIDVNEPPTIPAAFTLYVAENSPADVALVQLSGLEGVQGSDVDAGDVLTYTLDAGDGDRFVVEAATGRVLTTADSALDFEAQGTHTLTVRVSDAGSPPLSATTEVTVVVTDVNEPPILPEGVNINLRRNAPVGTVVGTVSAFDYESNTLEYSILSQTQAGMFAVNPVTGFVSVAGHRDLLEIPAVFTVTFQATETTTPDAFTDSEDLTVTITDANWPPVLTPDARYFVNENSGDGTAIGTVGFADPDAATQTFTFSLDGDRPIAVDWDSQTLTPTIVVDGLLNHESVEEFSVVLEVVDSHPETPLSDSVRIVIEIVDVNEAPSIDTAQFSAPVDGLSSLRVNEKSGGPDASGTVTVGTLSASDPDDDAQPFGTLSYSIGPGPSEDPDAPFPFAIAAVPGTTRSAVVTLDAPTVADMPDFETRPTYEAAITVTDAGGLSSTINAPISVIDRNDRPTMNPFEFDVAESALSGDAVGVVFGDDVDVPVDLTYVIEGGDPNNHFALDAFTGRLTIQEPVDYEDQRVYVLDVRATDKGRNGDTEILSVATTVTVNVLNVNDVTVTGFSGAIPHKAVGGETVKIHGTNFGPTADSGRTVSSVAVSYGETGTEYAATGCFVETVNTVISCTTSAGIGAGLVWRVQIDADGIEGDAVTSTATTRYKTPTISHLDASVLALTTAGGQSVRLFGRDFGAWSADVTVTYGSAGREYVATDCEVGIATTDALPSATAEDRQLTCKSAPGVGKDLQWAVTVRRQTSDAVAVVTTPAPLASGLHAASSVAAVPSGGAAPVSVSAYVPPAVTAVTPSVDLFTTAGGEGVVITGTNFGVAGLDEWNGVVVTYGPPGATDRYTALDCAVSLQSPHESITCLSSKGVGSGHAYQVAVGEQVSDPSTATTGYARPDVQSVTGTGSRQAKTNGGQRVVLSGREFGAADDTAGKIVVTYGPAPAANRFTAVECAVSGDHTTLTCLTAPGTGTDHSWIVTIDGQASDVLDAGTGYANPVISYFEGVGTVAGAFECEDGATECGVTAGSQEVLLHGLNFGQASLGNDIHVTYGAEGRELTAADCTVHADHVTLRCLTVEGAGSELKWVATIDGQESKQPTTSYALPRVDALEGPGAADASTRGGELVIIRGNNFGPPEGQDEYLEAVTYGPSGFEFTAVDCQVVSHTELRCLTAPGVGTDLKWVVRVEGQQSDVSTATTAYAAPELVESDHEVLQSRGTGGGYTVTLHAQNTGALHAGSVLYVEVAGLRGSPARLLVDPDTSVTPGAVTGVDGDGNLTVDPDVITFTMPEGRGKGLEVRLVSAASGVPRDDPREQASSAVTFHYDGPEIVRLQTAEVFLDQLSDDAVAQAEAAGVTVTPTQPLMAVTVRGVNFGSGPEPFAHSSVTVFTELAPFVGEPFNYTVAHFEHWDHEDFKFVVPHPGAVWLSIQSIGMDGTTHVQTSRQQSFDFDFPTISLLGEDGEPLPKPLCNTNGSTWVRIEGRNMWIDGVDTNVTIGGVNRGVSIHPDRIQRGTITPPAGVVVDPRAANQYVDVQVPPFQGTDVPLLVRKVFPNGNAPGSDAYMVDFIPPTVGNSVTQNTRRRLATVNTPATAITARTDGTSRVRLTGTSFGVIETSIEFTRGVGPFTDCVRDHSFIECTVPPGQGFKDDLGDHLAVWVVTPKLRCDPAELAADPAATEWDVCTVQADPSLLTKQRSIPWYFRYERPVVYSSTTGLSTTGGGQMVIKGINFGTDATAPSVTMQHPVHGVAECDTAGAARTVDASTGLDMLTCTVPDGVGTGWTVNVTVAGQWMDSMNATFDYAPPVLAGVSNATGPSSGDYLLTLTGNDLGGSAAGWTSGSSSSSVFGVVTIADDCGSFSSSPSFVCPTMTLEAESASHNHVTFRMPAGQGRKLLSVTVDGQVSNTVRFEYAAPELVALSPSLLPTKGGMMVLEGLSFGLTGAVVEVTYPVRSRTIYPNATDIGGNVTVLGTPLVETLDLRPVNCTEASASTVCSVTAAGSSSPTAVRSHSTLQVAMPSGLGDVAHVRVYVRTYDYTTAASNTLVFGHHAPTIGVVRPNVADSQGDELLIFGANFGGVDASRFMPGTEPAGKPYVYLDGQPCMTSTRSSCTAPPCYARLAVDTQVDDEPFLTCDIGDHMVGDKDVTLSVAFQTTDIKADDSKVRTECGFEWYGQEGEFCAPCPTGGRCIGGLADPVSVEGWYVMTVETTKDGCPAKHVDTREACPLPLPCLPAEACIGENQCGVGYRDEGPTFLCSACADGYYRLGNRCKRCPDNPWMLIAAFAVGAAFACLLAYWLNKKKVNIAFLSIGVDYFQVLAMFARSNVEWPAGLLTFFELMNIFSFDINVIGPKCAMPNLDFRIQWASMMLLPVAAVVLLGLVYFAQYFKKRCILGRRERLHTHLPTMGATLLVMMYFLYLQLTRSALDMFNCQPIPGGDGALYLSNPVERCDKPGGVRETLLPWAIISFFVYTVGYPALAAYILFRNRDKILEDQLLRAEGRGANRLENPHAYEVRKAFHKLYYHFKPVYYYWLLVIIWRKFSIAFVALIFTGNAAFQLSMALLVLFISYALQVRESPYMSMSEREGVLEDHRRRVAAGDRRHQSLAASIAEVRTKGKKKVATAAGWKASENKAKAAAGSAVSFFWNYNTVESTLLFCAVLVALGGLMFESGKFETGDFDAQKETLTWLVIFIIVVSVVYFLIVLASEVYLMCTSDKPKKAKKKIAGGKKQAAGPGVATGPKRRVVRPSLAPNAAFNPMFQNSRKSLIEDEGGDDAAVDDATLVALISRDRPVNALQWPALTQAVRELREQNKSLKDELAELKKRQQMVSSHTAGHTNRRRGNRANAARRQEFAPQLSMVPNPLVKATAASP